MKGRSDTLDKIVRNFKRKSAKMRLEYEEEKMTDGNSLQRIYNNLQKIHKDQSKLELMVDVLEDKSEKIDLFTKDLAKNIDRR